MAFSYYRSLTIDHTKCGSADSSNFPVLVSINHATFKTVANSGHVNNSNGFDIIFAADSAGATKLPWEVELYDGTAGILIAWVKIPTVSYTTDTVFYVLYGDTGISTAQNTSSFSPANVWDSNYKAVWHLGNGTTLSAADSTSNANNGTLVNTPTAVAGKINGGANFVKSSSQYIAVGAGASLAISGAVTIETWFYITTHGANSGARPFSNLINSGGWKGYELYLDSLAVYWQIGNGSSLHQQHVDFTEGVAIHLVVTYDGSSTGKIYINASAYTDTGFGGMSSLSGGSGYISQWPAGVGGNSQCMNGWIDEMRISNVARSASWVLTSYNNQNAPGNIGAADFITYGSESGGTPPAPGGWISTVNQVID